MRLEITLLAVAVALSIAISESKSIKKTSVKSKDHETKAVVKKSHSNSKEKESKIQSSDKGAKTPKTKAKVAAVHTKTSKKEKISKKSKNLDKQSAKPEKVKKQSKVEKKEKHDKPNKKVSDSTKPQKDNLKTIPHDCDEIVKQYANGEMVMFEYKIKIAKCLKGKEEKKSSVPATDAAVPAWPNYNIANAYPGQDQGSPEQAPNLEQSQAAFAQDTNNNQVAPMQQNYNFFTRSDIPAAAPQGQQDMTQWNTPNQDATKKDSVPAAPADDPFASFMNIQSSNSIAAPKAAQEQRSDVPAVPAPVPSPQELQQRSEIPIDASYQAPAAPAYNSAPTNQQAFFRDQIRAWSPEDRGLFPENP